MSTHITFEQIPYDAVVKELHASLPESCQSLLDDINEQDLLTLVRILHQRFLHDGTDPLEIAKHLREPILDIIMTPKEERIAALVQEAERLAAEQKKPLQVS